MAAVRTHYEILNVAPDAELVVIEAAYRALMKKYHPDQGGGAGAAEGPSAAAINQAYGVLRDPGRRADYDHKEWVRQRDLRLAAFQPPPAAPRQTNFFGWGGWLVSAVLAGMIALMASKSSAPQLSEAERVGTVPALPDMRTQPVATDKSLVTPAEAASIRAEAFAPRSAPEPPKAPPAAAAPVQAPPPAAPAAAVPAPAPAPAHRPAYARHHGPVHHRGSAVAARHDRDFLERQGYIY
jgi:curved DNA-binding protein CbpA